MRRSDNYSSIMELINIFNQTNDNTVLVTMLSLEALSDNDYENIICFLVEKNNFIKTLLGKDNVLKKLMIEIPIKLKKYPIIVEYFNAIFNTNDSVKLSSKNDSISSYYIIKDNNPSKSLKDFIDSHYTNKVSHQMTFSKTEIDNIFNIIKRSYEDLNQREYVINQTAKLFSFFSQNQKNNLTKLFYSYLNKNHLLWLNDSLFHNSKIIECNITIKHLSIINQTNKDFYDYYYYTSFNPVSHWFNKITFVLIYTCFNGNIIDNSTIFKMLICRKFAMKMYTTECPIQIGDNIPEDMLSIFNQGIDMNNIKHLFNENDVYYYDNIMMNIEHFYYYPIDRMILLNESNINFICGMIDLETFNNKVIKSNPSAYKKSLLLLEYDITNIYKDETGSNDLYSTNGFRLKEMHQDKNLKAIYKELIQKITESMIPICFTYNTQIHFFPFGSVTQFLSGKNADIDIFFQLTIQDKEIKSLMLIELDKVIRLLDRNSQVIISKRLCLIKFEYAHTKIDMNYFGVCSVHGSCLLREYSLYDARFPMLAITIKHLLKKLKLNSSSQDRACYLNSFSWMLLLITFLQDIINPPILPKILTNNNKVLEKIGIKGKSRMIGEVPYTVYNKSFAILRDLNNIGSESILLLKKNEMSCAEILIKFIEFIGFYCHFETVYVNSSFNMQCFQNKKELNRKEQNGHHHREAFFTEFYNDVFLYKQLRTDVLICEPFDHRYNPANNVSAVSMLDIIKKLQEEYYHIIQTGHL